jgi:uncharacterized protein (TIGR03083 family)
VLIDATLPVVIDVWTHVAAERRTLADFLETLEPADWDVRSLCTEWTVRDVVAHVAWGPTQPPMERMVVFAKGGFRINRVSAEHARRWGTRTPEQMVTRLREIAEDRRRPVGITDGHVLADIVCHDLDIRRPLGRPRPMPPEAFQLTADLLAGTGWPLDAVFARSPRKSVRGLRLIAQDLIWAHGEGLDVYGTAEALLLAITGRPVGRDELTGPGAALFYERLR